MGSIIPTRRSAALPVIALLVLAAAVVGWLQWRTPAERPSPPTSPGYDNARAQLAALPVKGWDRQTDFSRYRFGEPWSDDVNVEFGHNGCNTRDDILAATSRNWPSGRAPATRRAVSSSTRTPASRSNSFAALTLRRRSRLTTSSRCLMPGTRAAATGTSSAAAISPTTRATFSTKKIRRSCGWRAALRNRLFRP